MSTIKSFDELKAEQAEMLQTLGGEKFFDLMRAFITQRPGLNPRDYFSSWRDTEGVRAYRADQRLTVAQRKKALSVLYRVENAFLLGMPFDIEPMAEALVFRFSGRLNLKRNDQGVISLDYCPGQYGSTEYRAAALAVLTAYSKRD